MLFLSLPLICPSLTDISVASYIILTHTILLSSHPNSTLFPALLCSHANMEPVESWGKFWHSRTPKLCYIDSFMLHVLIMGTFIPLLWDRSILNHQEYSDLCQFYRILQNPAWTRIGRLKLGCQQVPTAANTAPFLAPICSSYFHCLLTTPNSSQSLSSTLHKFTSAGYWATYLPSAAVARPHGLAFLVFWQ